MTLADKLEREQILSREEFKTLLTLDRQEMLFARARSVAMQIFGNKIYIRGLIEFSNYCKQNCLYCGLRYDNRQLERYRLSKEEILECCEKGHRFGFKTFVLQSGEDNHYTTENMTSIIQTIRKQYPDYAITISNGEKDVATYQAYYDAGANRFLLRHETINPEHYSKLHARERKIETRTECLEQLKKIGFQTGSGIMVGSPGQTIDNIIDDIYFLEKLQPEMIGVGPYLVNKNTPFKNENNGSLELTLRLLSIFRLMCPSVLLPATTALETISSNGRIKGILAGANVVMSNLTPPNFRKNYQLYDGKTEEIAAINITRFREELNRAGYEISYERGDYVQP
jgi:biotin synthase